VEIFPEYKYQYEEDFRPRSEASENISSQSKFDLSKALIRFLTLLGLLAYCNDDNSTKKISPWVLSIRGHYSYRNISAKFLIRFAERCQILNETLIPDLNETCVTHYRLGDLLTITEKKPVSERAIATEYFRIRNEMSFRKLVVFSDSPSEARERFLSLIEDEMLVMDSKTSLVIANAIQTKYFIGTSSKISFWIAGIRAVVYQNYSSLPFKNVDQYRNLSGEQFGLISTYVTHSL
jgi:hypothetical protein